MPIRGSPNGAYHPHPQAGRDRPEWVVAINRNAWSQSIGIVGRDHPVRAEVHPNRNSASEDSAKVGTKQAEGAPSGGCAPVGLTAAGELVFPMQCDEERHRAASPNPVPTNSTSGSAPKERHAAEPNSAAGHEEQPSLNSADGEKDIAPSGAARPHNENSEPKADKTVRRRSMQSSRSRNEDQWFNPLAFR